MAWPETVRYRDTGQSERKKGVKNGWWEVATQDDQNQILRHRIVRNSERQDRHQKPEWDRGEHWKDSGAGSSHYHRTKEMPGVVTSPFPQPGPSQASSSKAV